MADDLDRSGERRHSEDAQRDHEGVAIHVEHAAEDVADRGDHHGPDSCAREVVGGELPPRHLGDAGGRARQRADERHEAGDQDRLGAVALEVLVGALEVPALVDAAVRAVVERFPGAAPDRVADLPPSAAPSPAINITIPSCGCGWATWW